LEKLEGHIEVDESYFGGHRKGKGGRDAGGKIPIFGGLCQAPPKKSATVASTAT
jgi:transposase